VILTARHVIRNARAVFVHGRRKWHRTDVLKTDSTWDVAALLPEDSTDFDTAEIAWRETGHPKAGDRLESCGFGADGRLAVNGGRFIGYRTTMRNRRQADWLVLSGYARQGDSGGPVFNSRGELIGVLWGSAGGEVVATQCGRLHVFLTQAVGPFCHRTKVVARQKKLVPTQSAGLLNPNRQPLLNPERTPICPLCRPRQPQPAPAPSVVVQADPRVGDSLASIEGKLDQVVANTAPPAEPETPEPKTHPLVMFLVIGGAVALGFVVYFASQKGD
jgi:hypothetical protein